MKKRLVSLLLCVSVCSLTLLCACNNTDDNPTVITKAPQDVVMRTDATTTVATTTTTLFNDVGTGDPDNTTADQGDSVTTTTTMIQITDSEASETGKAIAELAVSLIGTAFEFGANGPDAFDNPSFVVYCYKQNGFNVPRKASSMATWGEDVPPDELQAGDILVFANELGGDPAFCGIYVGDEKFVSCNNPDSPTKIQNLDNSYWGPRFVAARRPAEG